MPPPENKTPFKTMNIKSALLAASNRKRKAASPNMPVKHIKSVDDTKLTKDKSDDEVQIITEDSDIAATGDCKENTDLNVVKSEVTVEKLSPPLNNVRKENTGVQFTELSPFDRSLVESLDELTSNMNNSLSLENSNESSENEETQSKSETETAASSKKHAKSENALKTPSDANQNNTSSKRKKKMTPEEAKQRSEAREQKRKELLDKKKALEAQKLQRKLEKEQMRIQKEIERQEKENERKAKEKLKQEKKEQEEKEKQQKLKEKEDQKKLRQMQLEVKLEEKKKKEEERKELKLKREEEMKKAEEEKQKAKLEKEQKEKEKLERNKAAFMKFFVASNKGATAPVAPQVVDKEGAFKPFQVSDDMTLAPVVPPVAQARFNKDALDHALQQKTESLIHELYLSILKSGIYKDVRLRKRLREQRACDDVIIIDNIEPSELFLKAKLLQFSENVRPPYWGTWRKRSTKIGPRNPFGQDDIFDYTVDSDDEWDEGGPGESLSGTENEIESEDDYEVDNEFFVPHGYLSAEEEKEEEEDEEECDPEKQKAKLKMKQQEFEMERKKKTTELKPLILGCYIENMPQFQDPGLCSFLEAYAGEMVSDSPILTCFTVKKLLAESKLHSNASSPVAKQATSIKKKSVPEEAMPHLIRLVHGNINSRDTLIKEFQSFWQDHCPSPPEDPNATSKKPDEESPPDPNMPFSEAKLLSKRQLHIIIKKIATYGKSPNPALKRSCWYVQDDVREKYGLTDSPIPNEWNYQSAREEGEPSASPHTKMNCASIKEFLIP